MDVVVPEREVRRSFVLGVFNGAAFRFAEALIDPPLVLTWFVSQFSSPPASSAWSARCPATPWRR
jgi:hypothetical protein